MTRSYMSGVSTSLLWRVKDRSRSLWRPSSESGTSFLEQAACYWFLTCVNTASYWFACGAMGSDRSCHTEHTLLLHEFRQQCGHARMLVIMSPEVSRLLSIETRSGK
jgi:hypothetical protein